METISTIYKGNAKKFDVTITSDGSAVDITSDTVTFKLYSGRYESSSTEELSVDADVSTEGSDGIAIFTLSDTQTNSLDVGSYYYKIIWTDTSESTDRVVADGTVSVEGTAEDRVADIKTKYGFGYEYSLINEAYNWARKQIKENIFLKEEGTIQTDANNRIKIANYVMDSNGDGTVDKTDIEIEEYTTSPPYSTTDLSSNIDSTIFDYPTGYTYIVMDDSYPSSGSKLKITYYRSAMPYTDAKTYIELVEEYYVFYYLLNSLTLNKLQRGMPNKSINGLTLEFSQEGVKQAKDTIHALVQSESFRLLPTSRYFTENNRGESLFYSVGISKRY